MDKLMDSPWFLRITALLLAMLLFFTVKSSDDDNKNAAGTSTEVMRDIPVEVYYDAENLVVSGIPDTVDVTIDGPLNLVQTERALRDFTIFVDLREYTLGEQTVKIQHENISEKLSVRIDPSVVNVVIEEKITETVRVEPEINEQLLSEDYIVTDVKVEPSTVQITGAKSTIDAIAFVKASVSGEEGMDETFTRNTRVRVLDKELNKLTVSIEPEEVSMTVTIEQYSREVPIELRQRGTPREGVTINSLSANQRTVRVYGKRSVVDEMESLVVDVDISDVTASQVQTLNLKAPKGISKLSRDEIEVNVAATVEEETPEGAEVPAETPTAQTPPTEVPSSTEQTEPVEAQKVFVEVPIEVRGLSDQYKSTFIQPDRGLLTLTVRGKPEQINQLNKSDFKLFVDASRAKEGENEMTVSVNGPESVDWSLSSNNITLQVERA
ncbi:YbbR-like domain-containing protein [Chungangia koreensis]|uniref:YbbR-like domain-containing protein n=1 Tax=Chungangia koreensis TaxID=752657 RepID=A0ABV8X6S6_9LACT